MTVYQSSHGAHAQLCPVPMLTFGLTVPVVPALTVPTALYTVIK